MKAEILYLSFGAKRKEIGGFLPELGYGSFQDWFSRRYSEEKYCLEKDHSIFCLFDSLVNPQGNQEVNITVKNPWVTTQSSIEACTPKYCVAHPNTSGSWQLSRPIIHVCLKRKSDESKQPATTLEKLQHIQNHKKKTLNFLRGVMAIYMIEDTCFGSWI